MGINLPASVRAVLDKPAVRIVKRVELVREYWNADLRIAVDVSLDVAKWASLTNKSTIREVNWTVPNLTVSLDNANGRYSPDRAESIWQATLQRKPRDCALIFRLLLPLPDGTNYELQSFKASIEDCVAVDDGGVAVVDIVAKHMTHRPLSVKLNKTSGDETVLLGTTW